METVETEEMFEVPSEMMMDFYGIDATLFADFYCQTGLDNLIANEIIAVTLTDEQTQEDILPILQDRLVTWGESMQSYLPEQYEKIAQGVILLKDRTYLMFVTQNTKEDVTPFLEDGFATVEWWMTGTSF